MAVIQWAEHSVSSTIVKVDELNSQAFTAVIDRLHSECYSSMERDAERINAYYEVLDLKITPHITVANNQMFIVMTGVLVYRYNEIEE